MPRKSKKAGDTTRSVGTLASTDALLESVASPTSSSDSVDIRRWSSNTLVFVAMFSSALKQQRAIQRVSLFLEDPLFAGTIVDDVPPGRASASYSGHNMRMGDIADFANGASSLSESESELINQLELAGALFCRQNPRKGSKSNGYLSAMNGSCLLTVSKSKDVREAKDALRHELVHGAFYTCADFKRAVKRFWEESMRDHERDAWKETCASIGYNTSNSELVLNEFAAYMATERNIASRELAPSVNMGGQKRDTSVGKLLEQIQRRFMQSLEPNVFLR